MTKQFRGGGFLGSSIGSVMFANMSRPTNGLRPAGATWPFAKLSFDTDSLHFSFIGTKINIKYEAVSSAELTRTGYIIIHTKDGTNDFGFTSPRINEIEKCLCSQGVTADDSFRSKKVSARITVYAQVLLLAGFVGLYLFLLFKALA